MSHYRHANADVSVICEQIRTVTIGGRKFKEFARIDNGTRIARYLAPGSIPNCQLPYCTDKHIRIGGAA